MWITQILFMEVVGRGIIEDIHLPDRQYLATRHQASISRSSSGVSIFSCSATKLQAHFQLLQGIAAAVSFLASHGVKRGFPRVGWIDCTAYSVRALVSTP